MKRQIPLGHLPFNVCSPYLQIPGFILVVSSGENEKYKQSKDEGNDKRTHLDNSFRHHSYSHYSVACPVCKSVSRKLLVILMNVL